MVDHSGIARRLIILADLVAARRLAKVMHAQRVMQALVRLPERSHNGNAHFQINPDASMACWIGNKRQKRHGKVP
jgi:hypothetical protein